MAWVQESAEHSKHNRSSELLTTDIIWPAPSRPAAVTPLWEPQATGSALPSQWLLSHHPKKLGGGAGSVA